MSIDDLLLQLQEDKLRRGDRLAGAWFKQRLVERVGVEAAFALAVPRLGVPGLDRLRSRMLRPVREVGRTRGLDHREIWPGGTVHAVPPPRVVGAGDHGPIELIDRPTYLTCLDDALVRGWSDLLLRDDDVLLDFEPGEFNPAIDNAEFDPAVLQADDSRFWTMEPTGKLSTVPEAFMLCGAHSKAFGHWLVEFLPKLAMARLAGWRGGMPVLVDEAIPATVKAALPALLPPDSPVLSVPRMSALQVGKLWCASNAVYVPFYPKDSMTLADLLRTDAAPARFAALQREIGRMAGPATESATGIERLFLGRKPRYKKKLINAPEIEALVRRQGFHCVYPEDLSLLEQIRLARHARYIMAPEGSNCLLTWFAGTGARVCILGTPATQRLTVFSATLAALGIDAVLFTGPCATDTPSYRTEELWSFFNDYRIDVADLERFMEDWLA